MEISVGTPCLTGTGIGTIYEPSLNPLYGNCIVTTSQNSRSSTCHKNTGLVTPCQDGHCSVKMGIVVRQYQKKKYIS